MYSKFKNKTTTNDFVVSTRGSEHYHENKNVIYLGRCDEQGNITIPADQDEEYQNRTLQDHVTSVENSLKKKTALTVAPSHGESNEEPLTTDVDDEA